MPPDQPSILFRRLRGCLLFCCVGLIGCGGGRLEFISLNLQAIDPPSPRAAKLPLDACYWWTEEDGALRIAMRRMWRIPFVPDPFVINLSLDLDKLPSGPARNYEIGNETLRGTMRLGPLHGRVVSTRGILALYREPGDRLRGSLRITISRYTAQMLGGWSAPTAQILQGTFTATHDPQRGPAIRTTAWESGNPSRDQQSEPRP